jgi:hypothetical protein
VEHKNGRQGEKGNDDDDDDDDDSVCEETQKYEK